MATEADDVPLTVPELAREADVSPATLRNWASRAESPLATVADPTGKQMHTWAQLLEFCHAHPRLRATRKVLRRHATRGTEPHDRSRDVATDVLAGLHTAASVHLDAVVAALRTAEDVARSHREQLETLVRTYDTLLAEARNRN